tara:strand:+ start:93 stop:422 length:330 start_codon:yes stop_codon:yes gene_type:complete
MARFLKIDGSTNIDLRTYLLNLDKVTSVYNTGTSTVQVAYEGNFPEGGGVLQVIEIGCSVPFAQETPEDSLMACIVNAMKSNPQQPNIVINLTPFLPVGTEISNVGFVN